jgi:hypothetical protein
LNKYKILLIVGISAYTSLVARENPFAKAYEPQDVKEEITTEGINTELLKKEQPTSTSKTTIPEVKTLDSIEKEMKSIKKDPANLKNNEDNNRYIDGSPITEAVWEKLEKSKKEEQTKKITTTKPLPKKVKNNQQIEKSIITPIVEPIEVIDTKKDATDELPITKSYPIPDNEIQKITKPKVSKIKKHKIQKKYKVRKKHISKLRQDRYKTAFKNHIVTVQYANKSVKIITDSKYIKKRYFKNPKRVAFDFKRDAFFKSGNKYIQKNYASRIKVGAHEDFFRVTLNLKNKNRAITHTRPYGLLINFQ